MDDDIARVDQHPVADILAFQTSWLRPVKFILDPLRQLFSNRRHLTGRPTTEQITM